MPLNNTGESSTTPVSAKFVCREKMGRFKRTDRRGTTIPNEVAPKQACPRGYSQSDPYTVRVYEEYSRPTQSYEPQDQNYPDGVEYCRALIVGNYTHWDASLGELYTLATADDSEALSDRVWRRLDVKWHSVWYYRGEDGQIVTERCYPYDGVLRANSIHGEFEKAAERLRDSLHNEQKYEFQLERCRKYNNPV